MTINSDDQIWREVPESMNSAGNEGWMAKDGNFIYIYINGRWVRYVISTWIA